MKRKTTALPTSNGHDGGVAHNKMHVAAACGKYWHGTGCLSATRRLRDILGAALLLAGLSWCAAITAQTRTGNIVLVTVDGVRWQEVFHGVDKRLLEDVDFTENQAALRSEIWADDIAQRRRLLLPFFWRTVAAKGVLIGNRDVDSTMDTRNKWRLSYPGYSEMLTGIVDPAIESNDRIWNPNLNVLEWLNAQGDLKGSVAVFGSWALLPYVLNAQRSRLPINAGFMTVDEQPNDMQRLLNDLQRDTPHPWPTVRYDSFTHYYLMAHLESQQPRVIYIAYGETDDFAHSGRYDQYILSLHRTDRFIQQLWEYLQTQTRYKNNTTLLITTDHGRGERPLQSWRHHGPVYTGGYLASLLAYFKGDGGGAEHVWLAAMGPNIPALGIIQKSGGWNLGQVAATIAALLGRDFRIAQPAAAPPISELLPER